MKNSSAENVYQHLARLQSEKIVFAESCTGGMAAALMTRVSGVSEFFCGSTVTYRESAKTDWLKVDSQILAQYSAESQQTTDAMSIGVLNSIAEATISCAITGHLGPGAPADIDGTIFLAMCRRASDSGVAEIVFRAEERLKSSNRTDRQIEAAEYLLARLNDFLERTDLDG